MSNKLTTEAQHLLPNRQHSSDESPVAPTLPSEDEIYVNEEETPKTNSIDNQVKTMFTNVVVKGLGMFCNSYVLLAIGQIHPLLKQVYPECFGKKHQHQHDTSNISSTGSPPLWSGNASAASSISPNTCSDALVHFLDYAPFAGIIIGMFLGGFLGDRFGRRITSIATAFCMLLGTTLMASFYATEAHVQFTVYGIAQVLFGLGMGGEYPMTAAKTAEDAEHERQEREKAKIKATRHSTDENTLPAQTPRNRGLRVILPFSMQGVGNLTNCLVILVLLAAFEQTTHVYDRQSLNIIWRLQYALGCIPLILLVLYRVRYMEESDAWRKLKAQSNAKDTRLFLKTYWHRLVGTAGAWFVWDITFYGNKVFQTQFIHMFTPNSTIFVLLFWTTINSSIAMVGYYAAAFTMDKIWMGRRRMQVMGFAVLAVIFFVSAVGFSWLRTPPVGIRFLQILYFTTSFFGQFGPNATTWMFPAEMYPTHTRGFAFGLSGAGGKLGALVSGILFSYLGDQARFYACAACGAVGLCITLVFLPDVMSLDLSENDRFWDVVKHRSKSKDERLEEAVEEEEEDPNTRRDDDNDDGGDEKDRHHEMPYHEQQQVQQQKKKSSAGVYSGPYTTHLSAFERYFWMPRARYDQKEE